MFHEFTLQHSALGVRHSTLACISSFVYRTSYLVLRISDLFHMLSRILILFLSILVFSCQSKTPAENVTTAEATPFARV